MKYTVSALLILLSISIFGVRISKKITFEQNVTGYLKRAADANTIELANQELTKAINYLEANNLTSGYTSVLYKTPDEEIDFWYQNLKASQKELSNLNSNSALEKTNVLIKLRETLMDTGGKKMKVTLPQGLSVYPHNRFWAFLFSIVLFASLISISFIIQAENIKAKEIKAK